MPNGLKKMLDATFGTPAEGIKTLRELTSGETGKQVARLLTQFERLIEKASGDTSSLPQVLEILKVAERMGQAGYLKDLNGMLQNLPRGKAGQTMVTELRKMIDEAIPRIDKLANLAKVLMEKE